MLLDIYLIGLVFTAFLAAILTSPDEPVLFAGATVLLWFIALPVSFAFVVYLCYADRAQS